MVIYRTHSAIILLIWNKKFMLWNFCFNDTNWFFFSTKKRNGEELARASSPCLFFFFFEFSPKIQLFRIKKRNTRRDSRHSMTEIPDFSFPTYLLLSSHLHELSSWPYYRTCQWLSHSTAAAECFKILWSPYILHHVYSSTQ
jgi:hypothetical protein